MYIINNKKHYGSPTYFMSVCCGVKKGIDMKRTKKIYSIKITIYPDLYQSEYHEYVINTINEWIADCQLSSRYNFALSCTLASGISTTYDYNQDTGNYLDTDKLWVNKHGSYNINIHGVGDFIAGAVNSIKIPSQLLSVGLSSLDIRTKEYTSKNGLEVTAFGRTLGIPYFFQSQNPVSDTWALGTTYESDCICHDFGFRVTASDEQSPMLISLFNELKALNKGILKDYSDSGSGYFELDGQYVLVQDDKEEFATILRNIFNLALDDYHCNIESLRASFISLGDYDFFLESYSFDETNARLVIRHKTID